MLKKIIFTFVAFLGISTAAMAADSYGHDSSVLPQTAQSTLSNFFQSPVSVVNIDKDFGRVSEYEVVLSDGTEITFDRQGNWKDVEVNAGKAIPSAFVPHSIANYVKSNYEGQSIVGIEKNRHNIEVELSNGVELKFSNKGVFLKVD